MDKARTAWNWAVRATRLLVGIPDYDSYIAYREAHHPGEPAMSYIEFFRERERARYACENGRFKGCC